MRLVGRPQQRVFALYNALSLPVGVRHGVRLESGVESRIPHVGGVTFRAGISQQLFTANITHGNISDGITRRNTAPTHSRYRGGSSTMQVGRISQASYL
jgi:hypothetical protein